MNLLCVLGLHKWCYVMTAFTFAHGEKIIGIEWHICDRCPANKLVLRRNDRPA